MTFGNESTKRSPPKQAVESESSNPNILYMVSDSEGCQENRDTANIVTQSSAICNQPFFDEITGKMTANPNMKFAFLGDYFDQGPKVRQTIKGMMALHKLFNEKGKPERVFIILGNRDVNKLRFMFESNNKLTTLKESDPRWGTWKGYYDVLDVKQTTLGSVDHVTHILATSMGANPDIGLTSFLPDADSDAAAVSAGKVANARVAKGKADNAFKANPSEENKSNVATAVETLKAAEAELLPHKEKAIPYLKTSFRINTSSEYVNALDVVAFFKLCKICHYDADSKSFLSHGGGWYRDAFFNQAFVDSLITGDSPVNAANYLKMMEKYRLALFTGVMDPKYKAASVQESVKAYNDLLTAVLNEVDGLSGRKTFTPKFVLLQALGLKPTPYEDSKYRSVIQSCSQNGCAGISPDKFKNDDAKTDDNNIDDLFDLFQKSGVEFVSYGHKPACYYVPLIYRRTDSKGRKITFISNDTSNGNRPLDKLGNNIVMVTSIENSGSNLVAKVDMFGNDEAKRAEISGLHPGLVSGAEPPQYEKYADDDGGLYKISYSGGPIINMNDEMTNVGPGEAYGRLKLYTSAEEARASALDLKVKLADKRAKAAAAKAVADAAAAAAKVAADAVPLAAAAAVDNAAKQGGRRRRGTKRRRAATRRVRRGNNNRKTNRRVKRSRSRHHSRL